MKLGFGRIEAALQAIHDVPPKLHPRFRSRLRYLQRSGFGIPRAGVGRKANFSVGHAFLFEFAIQLWQFGLEPEQVAEAILECDDELREAVYETASRSCDPAKPVLVILFPEARAGLTDEFPATVGAFAWRNAADVDLVEFLAGDIPRMAVMNLTAVIGALVEHLAPDGAGEALLSELIDWANKGGQE